MVSITRVLFVSGSLLATLVLLGHLNIILVSHGSIEEQTSSTKVDAKMMSKLLEFPTSVKAFEKKLLQVEETIQDLEKSHIEIQSLSLLKGDAPKGPRWRSDKKCGKNVPLLADGGPVECNPEGEFPCCSVLGWCGNSASHCECSGCINYRVRDEKDAPKPPPKLQTPPRLQHHSNTFPPPSAKDGHEGSTVVVITPFRDREAHLVEFKKYWRWFADKGNTPKKVLRWEVFIIEQFDAKTFNRGWNFNCGLAIASAQTSASPEISIPMGIDFDCAVIQDIDYLPERGVDYGDCDTPIQLSSEIDRYNWKTPYIKSAGGIVGMSLKHWRQINGFGNNYFGWGGEDDEVHHRLRLNGLLFGDCYPYCKKKDPDLGKPGISIRRPRKGFGRFSGKSMHSANHTKRITDSKAYSLNVDMLKEIEKGGKRWKNDGLSDLAFRIVDSQQDDTDKETHGITYHHIRVRRGTKSFDVRSVPMAVPPGFCDASRTNSWILKTLGPDAIPWDIESLRARAASWVLGSSGNDVICAGSLHASFLLIDRRRQLTKLFTDADPRLLTSFLRSLENPETDGLIVADPRSYDHIKEAFSKKRAWAAPPTEYNVCTSPLKEEGPKYSIHQGSACSGGGWEQVANGIWRGYSKPQTGMQLQALSFCDNEKHWTQLMVHGDHCLKKLDSLKYVHGDTMWVAEGKEFCVGLRKHEEKEELTFSRLLRQENCDGDGFRHEFNFASIAAPPLPVAFSVCVGQDKTKQVSRVSIRNDCNEKPFTEIGRFAARLDSQAGDEDSVFCVESDSAAGEIIREHGKCGSHPKFSFAIPKATSTQEASFSIIDAHLTDRQQVCVGSLGDTTLVSVGAECQYMSVSLQFAAPSVLDIVSTTPSSDKNSISEHVPLFVLVEESINCFSFLCQNVLL